VTAPAKTTIAPPGHDTQISQRLVLLLAVSCGVAVANLYYAQPLLHTIAHSFGVRSGTASLIVTLGQIGYAVGLALLVPVGDLIQPRRLVPAVLTITAVALVVSALAPNITVLIVVALLVGLGTVAAQILVPLAASLASDEKRGQVVGTVMTGLLLGILLARTVSGFVAAAGSWRTVFWVAAALTLTLVIVLSRALPVTRPQPGLRYGGLLRSTVQLFLDQPMLRRRCALGALGMATFSVFWTTIAFLLAGPPYHYSDEVIGLFGLVGAAGALCASFAGKLADRGHSGLTTSVFTGLIAVSFAPIAAGRTSVWWLIVGIVLLDVGVQGLQVTNQSLIYTVAPHARSRITSAYMVCYFAGGAAGSAAAGAVYDSWGWGGICWLGAGIGVAASVLSAVTMRQAPFSRRLQAN
jgi:predicted MFS family arabinose efflux permease